MNIHDLNRRVQPDHNPYQHKSGSDVAKPVQEKVDLFELALEENAEQRNQALRYNQGKPQWSLVDFPSLEPMVKVLEYGCQKYARDNWRAGMPASQIIESMLRHTFELLKGDKVDKESLCEHVGHIQVNAMFLAYVLKEKPQFDDLPKN